jgi:hypothetical protein
LDWNPFALWPASHASVRRCINIGQANRAMPADDDDRRGVFSAAPD